MQHGCIKMEAGELCYRGFSTVEWWVILLEILTNVIKVNDYKCHKSEWLLLTPTFSHFTNVYLQYELGCDCGVFICMYADFIAMDYPLIFTQDCIDKCQERMPLAILGKCSIGDTFDHPLPPTIETHHIETLQRQKEETDDGFEPEWLGVVKRSEQPRNKRSTSTTRQWSSTGPPTNPTWC